MLRHKHRHSDTPTHRRFDTPTLRHTSTQRAHMICQGASTHTRHILDTVLDTHRHFDTVSTDTTLDTASTLLRHSSTPTLQTVRVDHCPLSHSGRWRPTLPTGSGAGGPHLSGECTERRAPSPHCPLRWGQWAHTQSGFLCLKAIFSAALRVKSSQHTHF